MKERIEMDGSTEWRPLIAVLANAETRRVAAELMLGGTLDAATANLSPSRRRRVSEALVRSGLIDADTHAFVPDVFRAVIEAAAVSRQQGRERFMDGTRIRQYPANLDERGELLAWVARSAFADGEVLTEHEVNDRLLPYSEDVAVLRRYLVDYQLVERRADGTEYALTGSDPIRATG